MYSKEELSNLSRKELQKLCKKFNLKGNGKNIDIALRIWRYFEDLKNEEKNLVKELEENVFPWVSDDEENNDPLNSTFTLDKENNQPNSTIKEEVDDIQLKNEILKEVEKRAEEKATKIPKLMNNYILKDTTNPLMSPTAKYFRQQHSKNNERMESVDEYLAKRRQRAEKMFSYQKELKRESEKVLKSVSQFKGKAKKSDVHENLTSKVKKSKTPVFTKANLKKDKEVSFNLKNRGPSFAAQKNPPTKLGALKEKDPNVSKKRLMHNGKSFHTSSRCRPKSTNVNFSKNCVVIARTPNTLNSGSKCNKKTPIKFDLEASLKKPLKYTPHTGKIKNVYFTAGIKNVEAQCRDSANKSLLEKRKSVKDLTLNVTTRESRRATSKYEKKDRRTEIYAKRRGILHLEK